MIIHSKKKAKRIEIMGCMGSGKTTLCKTLHKLGWHAILEDYRANPFLYDFWEGNKCAFELQTCFLLQHFYMIKNLELGKNNVISDFSFLLDSVYASLLLSSDELRVYNTLLSHVMSKMEKPDYIIKLTCPNNILLDRINIRNREFERSIDSKFIKSLNEEISNYVIDSKEIVVDSSKVDFFNEEDVYYSVIKEIV